uniref:DNA-directed RNA polymerase III subunit RPC6 n=1 Tax=Panagrellus redivivus TaxID=6233 RepID=A0A7E4VKX3_PANRE
MASAEDQIIAALKPQPEGIPLSELGKLLPGQSIDKIINHMLGTKIVEMVKNADGNVVLRLCKGTQLSGSTPEEQLVFSLIEEAGATGLWIREIRDRSGLTETQMKRVLKTLEKKKLVKAIKAVGTTRKCYMLYNLDADESVSGGVFYSNQEVDSGFVKTLIDVSVAFLSRRHKQAQRENTTKLDVLKASCVHVSEVAEFIRQNNVCTVAFGEEDVEHILELAWKRNRVYKQDSSGYYRYRATKAGVDGTSYAICNFCPVRSECRVGHKISPETCVYFDSIRNVEPASDAVMDDLDYDSDY